MSLLDLPPFLLGVFFLYWSLPIGALLGKIRFWKLSGSRNDAYGWAIALQQMFGVRFLFLDGPRLYTGGKFNTCLFLSNHRSWADFFLDVVATEGYAQMLSRWAVFWVFPVFMSSVIIVKSVILFKRDAVRDKEAFNRMLDRKLAASPIKSLIVYPEGHRSVAEQSLPIKRGMLHYAYSRKHPVQVVMTANKEAVISEKAMSAHFGQTVVVGYSQVIHSRDSPDFEDFVAKVQRTWDEEWKRVMTANQSDIRWQAPPAIDDRTYPRHTKALMVLVGSGSIVLLFTVLYWSARAGAWLLSLFGSWRPLVTGLLVAFLAVSLAKAFQPIRPLPSVPPAVSAVASKTGQAQTAGPDAAKIASGQDHQAAANAH